MFNRKIPGPSLFFGRPAECRIQLWLPIWGVTAHASSGWNIVKYTAEIWDSQIPYWIAWSANLPASRGMINPDGTDIQVLHLYTSFMLCLPLDLMVWRQTKCGYRGWSYDDEKMAEANGCWFAFDQPAGTLFQWIELRNISGAQISLTFIFNPKYWGVHVFSPNFPSNSGFMMFYCAKLVFSNWCIQHCIQRILSHRTRLQPGNAEVLKSMRRHGSLMQEFAGFYHRNLNCRNWVLSPSTKNMWIWLKQLDWNKKIDLWHPIENQFFVHMM